MVGEEREGFVEAVRFRRISGAIRPNARGDSISDIYGVVLKD